MLEQIFNIHLRHENLSEPFGPMVVMDGRRSMIPGDLDDTQVELLRKVLVGSTTPAVRARIGDVLWVDPDQWFACMKGFVRARARASGRVRFGKLQAWP